MYAFSLSKYQIPCPLTLASKGTSKRNSFKGNNRKACLWHKLGVNIIMNYSYFINALLGFGCPLLKSKIRATETIKSIYGKDQYKSKNVYLIWGSLSVDFCFCESTITTV